MVKSPKDKLDIEDYDNPAEYISDAMEEGWTMEGSDFEGVPCSYCGRTVGFIGFMQNPDAELVTWDIRIQDIDDPEPEDAVMRYYFCHPQCKHYAQRDEAWLSGEESYGEGVEIKLEEREAMC